MRDKRYKALLDAKAEVVNASTAILDGADAEGRDLSDEERATLDANSARLETIKADLARFEAARAYEREMTAERPREPRVAAGWAPASERDAEPTTRQETAAREQRFGGLGEQLMAVAAFGRGEGFDRRLIPVGAAATGLNEGIGGDGGFLVQTDYSSTILQRAYDTGEVLRRCRQQPISANANGIKLPAVDETSRANGSRFGGIRAYWAAEADTVTATRPRFKLIEIGLNKLMVLVYATDELLADATALESWIMSTVPQEINFVLEDAIINGTGAGQPAGIMSADALVTVAKETSQTAATVNATNVQKMHARMPARNRSSAVWLVNQDVEPQFPLLTVGNYPTFQPDYTQAPGGRLLGKPVVPTEYNATLGTVGDILLTDLSQYILATKGGVMAASSMHVRFLYDEMVFRFVLRVDGQPAWHSALTPYKGSNTISPFVALATRA